ncbi:MAG: hypothetical protein A2Y65_04170 [Deltaproteobacteria bacterium RBG_13_52_11]|nr:MAG: hypothetical protein A2Y65_04170 [Deltaproteobacteria bacterium RBG_13_52_11]
MNTKKKSKKLIGVIVFGILILIFSIGMLVLLIVEYVNNKSTNMQTLSLLIVTLGLLLSGMFVLKRREWARKMLILLSLCFIIDTFIPLKYFIEAVKKPIISALIVIALGLILFISIIYYFMRKNVRSFFKGEDGFAS